MKQVRGFKSKDCGRVQKLMDHFLAGELTVESSQEIQAYRIFIGRVVDQHDTGNPPLIWQRYKFLGLKPL